ncbi:MAG: FHA domain-containing protein, partial [Acidimicrobiales bacterium]
LPECTISFDDPNISRNHAEIRPDGTGFVITDLGSTNGTKVNGARITRHRLVDGDRVSLGATVLDFRAG